MTDTEEEQCQHYWSPARASELCERCHKNSGRWLLGTGHGVLLCTTCAYEKKGLLPREYIPPETEQMPTEPPPIRVFALVDGLPATITNPAELDVVWRLARLIDSDPNETPAMAAFILATHVVDLVKNRKPEMALFLAGSLHSIEREFPQNHG